MDEDNVFKAFIGFWVVWLLLVLAFWVAAIVVAIHFLAKVW